MGFMEDIRKQAQEMERRAIADALENGEPVEHEKVTSWKWNGVFPAASFSLPDGVYVIAVRAAEQSIPSHFKDAAHLFIRFQDFWGRVYSDIHGKLYADWRILQQPYHPQQILRDAGNYTATTIIKRLPDEHFHAMIEELRASTARRDAEYEAAYGRERTSR